MGEGYVIFNPEMDKINFEFGRPDGHMILGAPMERDYNIVEGNIRVPVEKFAYAIDCICGKSHPVSNNKILWDKIFEKEWDRNEL